MECEKGNGSRSNEEDEVQEKRNWKVRTKKTKEIEEMQCLNSNH